MTSGQDAEVGGPLAVGVDAGGTYLKGGLVAADGTVLARARRVTPRDGSRAVEDALVDLVAQLLPEHLTPARRARVLGVGVGAAGLVDHARGTVVFSPHLPWRDEPLRKRLAARLGLPVRVDNDANVAAAAEHRLGAGRGEDHLLVVTLGTGIGGAFVLRGRLARGRHGLAGEYGHMALVPDGRACECGQRGCWEQYASGSALRRAARARLEAGGPGTEELMRLCDGRPEQLRGEHVTRAASAGDPVATELLAEVGGWLGAGLATLAAALDPGRVVVGGGLAEAGELLLGPARVALARRLPGAGHRPAPLVRAARLGSSAGLVGAAGLLLAPGRTEVWRVPAPPRRATG